MDEGVENGRDGEHGVDKVGGQSAQGGKCAAGTLAAGCHDKPRAHEIEGRENEAGGYGGTGGDEERGPGIGRGNVNDAVNVLLKAKVRDVEDGAEEASGPVFEQGVQDGVEKGCVGSLPDTKDAVLLPEVADDLGDGVGTADGDVVVGDDGLGAF